MATPLQPEEALCLCEAIRLLKAGQPAGAKVPPMYGESDNGAKAKAGA